MIYVDISKCTGCRSCESACAFFHSGKVGNCISRIKVMNLYELGIDGPVVCIQCEERYCMSCLTKALSIGPLGQVIVSPTLCTLCDACTKNCSIGAIEKFGDFIYVCDLCGGMPKCVEACTEQAITYLLGTGKHASLAELKKETRNMNLSQKRHAYIERQGLELRKRWREKRA